jgi:hypothetical protein
MLNEESDGFETVRVPVTPGETPSNPAEVMILVAEDQEDNWYGYKGVAVTEDQITSLDDAIEHVLAQHLLDGARRDIKVADLDKWVFGLLDGVAIIAALGPEHSADRDCLLRHTAFGHLCARVKAPPGYLRSIPTRYSVPALNWGIKHRSDGSALIRLAGDEARAIVSQRYTALDDSTALPQLRAGLEAAGLLDNVKARVVATGLTTIVRLGVDGDAIAIPGTDEIAEIALDFTNGEVGNRAVALSPSVYLRSRGLATRRAGLRLRHLGAADRLAEAFRDAVPEVLHDSRKLRDQIAKAVDRAIADLVGEADKLRSFGLSLAEARDVVRQVAQGAGVTLPHDTAEWEEPVKGVANVRAYDVFLAVAALGEGRSIDRRLDLEEAAAKYLARVTK